MSRIRNTASDTKPGPSYSSQRRVEIATYPLPLYFLSGGNSDTTVLDGIRGSTFIGFFFFVRKNQLELQEENIQWKKNSIFFTVFMDPYPAFSKKN
jgi:hypothetical protein